MLNYCYCSIHTNLISITEDCNYFLFLFHLFTGCSPIGFKIICPLTRLSLVPCTLDLRRTAAFALLFVLTSSDTPELCVSLFPSVMVMITDGSRKNGLRPCKGEHGDNQL